MSIDICLMVSFLCFSSGNQAARHYFRRLAFSRVKQSITNRHMRSHYPITGKSSYLPGHKLRLARELDVGFL